jgi:hypothetical protein
MMDREMGREKTNASPKPPNVIKRVQNAWEYSAEMNPAKASS